MLNLFLRVRHCFVWRSTLKCPPHYQTEPQWLVTNARTRNVYAFSIQWVLSTDTDFIVNRKGRGVLIPKTVQLFIKFLFLESAFGIQGLCFRTCFQVRGGYIAHGYACVIVYACSSHTDSESDSEDSSVPDAGNPGDSNGGGHIDPDVEEPGDGGGHIDPDVEEPGDEREDDDEGGSEDFPDFPEEEGRFHTMADHLAKLDGLAVRGCADKFFSAYSGRWGSRMPRTGDVLHSARHGGEDARESRKRKADGLNRSLAETHAFITSSNASEARGDGVIETFCSFEPIPGPIARFQSN